jgi:2-amino-4-hydroxy-6-hydroxymethyldihydropteridine diphosphokinase
MAGLPRTSDRHAPAGGWRYLIALGSNVRHHRHGPPQRVLAAALAELQRAGLAVERASAVIASAALGPSRRRYANGVALVSCDLAPPQLLALLKAVERQFGRRGGRRWGERVLDLDIVLWEGGCWRGGVGSARLVVPHGAFRERGFVLGPALAVAPLWRDPGTGLTLRQLAGRHTRHARRQQSGEGTP